MLLLQSTMHILPTPHLILQGLQKQKPLGCQAGDVNAQRASSFYAHRLKLTFPLAQADRSEEQILSLGCHLPTLNFENYGWLFVSALIYLALSIS